MVKNAYKNRGAGKMRPHILKVMKKKNVIGS